jgi:hypothetical protein
VGAILPAGANSFRDVGGYLVELGWPPMDATHRLLFTRLAAAS